MDSDFLQISVNCEEESLFFCQETFKESFDHHQETYDGPDPALPVRAYEDPVLTNDDRVLFNLLKLESRFLPSAPDYFRFVQTEINPAMRKIVADWMLQVCEELTCGPEVFSMAMNYLDRFLALCRVTKSKLQLIGSVCLLLSSKFKETNPITGEKLIYFSDFSITSPEIRDTELLVLQELRWELSAVTPLDFLDQLIFKLKPDLSKFEMCQRLLKQRTETILVLSQTDYKFCYLNPSLLACSALFAVISSWALSFGINGTCGKNQEEELEVLEVSKDLKKILDKLIMFTQTKANDLHLCTKELISCSPKYLLQFKSEDKVCKEEILTKENPENFSPNELSPQTNQMSLDEQKDKVSPSEMSSHNKDHEKVEMFNDKMSFRDEMSGDKMSFSNEMSGEEMNKMSPNLFQGDFQILTQSFENEKSSGICSILVS